MREIITDVIFVCGNSNGLIFCLTPVCFVLYYTYNALYTYLVYLLTWLVSPLRRWQNSQFSLECSHIWCGNKWLWQIVPNLYHSDVCVSFLSVCSKAGEQKLCFSTDLDDAFCLKFQLLVSFIFAITVTILLCIIHYLQHWINVTIYNVSIYLDLEKKYIYWCSIRREKDPLSMAWQTVLTALIF